VALLVGSNLFRKLHRATIEWSVVHSQSSHCQLLKKLKKKEKKTGKFDKRWK
jgi:hypothetical protein